MQNLNIHSAYLLLDLIAVFLLLFFAIFLFSISVKPRYRQILLACFFLALAFSYMDGVFISLNYYFHIHYPYIVHLGMSFDFLVGPLLLLFILSMSRANFSFKPGYYLQGLPFVAHALFLLWAYLQHQGQTNTPIFSREHVIALTSLSSLHLLIYMLLVLHELVQYKTRIKKNYSDFKKHSLAWLSFISCGLLVAGISRWLNNITWLLNPELARSMFIDFKLFALSGVFIFACVVVFKSLKQPIFFDHNEGEKQKANKLDTDTRQLILKKIQAYMKDTAPYLEADFDLAALAKGIDTPAYRVSQVINAELQQNFFDFVNAYRIGESRRLLKDNDKSITEIMYAAGFNSKSVFNTTFKKHTGLTPSQYRKSPDSLQFQ